MTTTTPSAFHHLVRKYDGNVMKATSEERRAAGEACAPRNPLCALFDAHRQYRREQGSR